MERFEPEQSIFPRIELFQAPERVLNAARFVLDRLYFDVPAQPEIREER